MVLFIMLYKVVLSIESVNETLQTFRMKALDQPFHVALYITLHKVVIIFKSAGPPFGMLQTLVGD